MVIAVSDAVRYLVFPLIVLLVGAFASGLFIPRFTNRRDARRKALEVKTQLVSDISEVVMRFVMAVRFAVLGAVSQTTEEYENAYKAWEKDRAVLGTKLEAYFPRTDIGSKWDEFCERLKVVHEVARIQDAEDRKNRVTELVQKYEPGYSGSNQTAFEEEWSQLERKIIFAEKRKLIDTVMRSLVVAFETPPLRERIMGTGSRVFRSRGQAPIG